jgi:hypothetical protein
MRTRPAIGIFQDAASGGNYQTLINQALRKYLNQQSPLEEILRRVVREELRNAAQLRAFELNRT